MALPSSGALSLDDIQTEFGGTNPIAISEYYGAATGVPASGTISISDFYGTSAGFPPVTLGYWAGGQGAAQTNTIRRIQYSNDTVSLRPATLPSGTSAGVALQDTTNAFIVEGRNGPNSPNIPTGGNIMKFQFSNETASNPPATFQGSSGGLLPSPTNNTEGSFGVSSQSNGYRTGGNPGSSNISVDELSKIVFSTETTSVSPSSSNLLPIPREFGDSLGTVSTGFLAGGKPQPPFANKPSNPGVTKFTYSTETYSNVSSAPAIGSIRFEAVSFVDRENDFGYIMGGRKFGTPFPTARSFDMEKINLTNDTQSDLGDFGPGGPSFSSQFSPFINFEEGAGNFSPSAGYVFFLNKVYKFPFANETFDSAPAGTQPPFFAPSPAINPFTPITPSPTSPGYNFAIPFQV